MKPETLKKNLWVSCTLAFLALPALADHTVAITILAEAGNQSEAGQTAVMAVIAQRAIERGLTHKEVCLERKQFSCWNGKRYEDLEHLLDTPQAKHALWLEANSHLIDLDVTQRANHYHATWMQRRPYWARNEDPLYVIGDHAFYRL